jgi:hypothetical protein
MNPDLMTVDECRDWLARDDDQHELEYYHPYEHTIDAAARAMPKEFWYKVFVNPNGRVDAIAQRGFMTIDVAATTELTARYRLAVKCRLALKTRSE